MIVYEMKYSQRKMKNNEGNFIILKQTIIKKFNNFY